MLVPIITTIAEFLFYLTNGFAIFSGMLYLPYLIFTSVVVVFFMFYAIEGSISFLRMISLFSVIFIFMIALSVPLAQDQMLTECTQFEQPYETKNTSGTFTIKECKIKPNYFENEFYWKSYVRN